MKFHVAILLSFVATSAAAQKDYTPLPLALETTEVACDPQPSDEEKLRKAIAFYIRPLDISVKSPLGDGYFDASLFTSVESALAAQPDCCQVLYKDAELYGSERLKARLGDNFGGFVRIRFEIPLLSGAYNGRTFLSTGYYVLDSCGNPVFDL